MSTLETIHTGIDFGEGPRWHGDQLWFSDFYRHGVFTLDAAGVETRRLTVSGRPSGLGWMPDATMLVVSMTDRRVLAVDPDGEVSEHADLSDLAAGFTNDMVVAADGTAYVGNFGFDSEGAGEFAPADLVMITPEGEASVAAKGLMFPNGSVITPDGSILVVAETYGARYTAFDIGSGGELSSRRTWAEVPGSAPDGCCLDAEGAIWMADFTGQRVARVLEGGEITHSFATDGHAVAAVLGGDDRRTLSVFVSPGSHPDVVAGKGLSTIVSTRVEVPGAGLP